MMRCFVNILISIFTLVFLLAFYLGINQNHRNHLFSILAELPSYYVDYRLKNGYLNSASGKDFSEISKLLYWQFDIIKRYEYGTSRQLSSLMDNTRIVVEQLSFKRDGASLALFLNDLANYQPKSFEANLWAARALAVTSPETALSYAHNAQKLLPSDPRSYEILMEIALSLENSELISEVCELYANQGSLGSYQPTKYPTLFGGYGVSKLGLEVLDTANSLLFFELPRLSTGSKKNYVLNFNSVQFLKELRFHLRFPIGYKIKFHKLKLLRSGKIVASINDSAIKFVGRGGFFDENSNFIVVGPNQTLTLQNISSTYKGETSSDQIKLEISIGKLSPASPNFCKG